MNNELNMLIKAKVVKLRVELDYANSKLFQQVDRISRVLRKKPVRLRIELFASQSDVNAEVNKLRALARTSKPIRVGIDVDPKGSQNVTNTLNNVTNGIRRFNKNYKQEARTMTATKQQIQKAMTIQNVPTSGGVQNYNNIKQYKTQLLEVERIMRSKVNGKAGLFSTVQMKDAQGNLKAFTATLKTADGMIEKIRYKWNAQKGAFTPVSRQTLDNTQRQLTVTRRALETLTRAKERDWAVTRSTTRQNSYAQLEQGVRRYTMTTEQALSAHRRLQHQVQQGVAHNRAYTQSLGGVNQGASQQVGLFRQIGIAMQRVPIWMGAMTLFYGSIRAVRQAVTQIIEVDKAMTEIRRVASDSINIDSMFDGSVALSKELGNNLHDILGSVGELSRTFGEFNERQLLAITRTATLMSNVSDLQVEEASRTLVGTMNAFNITAEESIRIVDSLNEVDNNYAISTKQLAEGLQKTASTARTFGVTLEESVGHITAIGSVTMESGRLIGNSLKTIYSRITTLGSARTLLEGVGVAIHDIGKNGEEMVRPVGDILNDLSVVWFDLTDAQRQNLAVTVAGRYQLSRFIALMNNYETATSATNTAVFSQGSAMRENAEYLRSFEARINQMKNAFVELAMAIGDSVLNSAIMEFIRLMVTVAGLGVKVAGSFGALPAVLGTIALLMLQFGKFSGMVGGLTAVMTAMRSAFMQTSASATVMGGSMARTTAVASTGFSVLSARISAFATSVSAKMAVARTAVMTFGTAFQTMLAKTVVLAGFVAVGIAIEKLLNAYNRKKEAEQELIKLNDKMVDSYRTHRDGMDGLLDRYEVLSETTNRTKEEEQEYLNLQKQLAEQIPTTVAYIDANGEAHMKSTTEIRREVEAVKELSKAQAELTQAKFLEDMNKKSEAYMKILDNIKDLNEEQEKLKRIEGVNPFLLGTDEGFGTDDLERLVKTGFGLLDSSVNKEIQQSKVNILMAEAEKTEAIQRTIQSIQEQAVAYFEAGNKMSNLGDEQTRIIEKFISYNESMLRYADTPEKFEQAYQDLFDIGVEVGEVFVKAFDIMSQDMGNDPLALGQLRKDLGQVADAIPETFFQLSDEFGKPTKSVEELRQGLEEIVNVSNRVAKGDGNWKGLVDRLEEAGMTTEEAQGYLNGLAREHRNAELRAEAQALGVDEVTTSIEDLNEKTIEAIDLHQGLFGIGSSEIEAVKNHLQLLHLIEDTQGEAGKATAEYFDAQVALTDFLGITTEELDNNRVKYEEIADALSELSFEEYNSSMSWKKFIESQDISDAQKEILLAWNGTKDIITGNKREIVDANAEIATSTEDIKDIFGEEITDNAVLGAVKETKKAVEEDSWMENFKVKLGDMFKIDDEGSFGNWVSRFFSDEAKLKLEMELNELERFINDFPDRLKRGWDNLGTYLDDSFGNIPSETFNATVEYGGNIMDWLSNTNDDMEDATENMRESFLGWLEELPENTSPHLDEWMGSINGFFNVTANQWMDNLDEWGDPITDWFTGVPDEIRELLGGWGDAIDSWADTVDWDRSFNEWGEDLTDWFTSVPDKIEEQLGQWTSSITTWFDDNDETMSNGFNSWGDNMVDWFVGVPDKIRDWLGGWGDSVDTYFDENEETLGNNFEKWDESALNWFTGFPDKIREKLGLWDGAIVEWADSYVEDGDWMGGFNDFGDDLVEWFTGVPAMIDENLGEWDKTVATWGESEKPEWLEAFRVFSDGALDLLKPDGEKMKILGDEWSDELLSEFKPDGEKMKIFGDEWSEKLLEAFKPDGDFLNSWSDPLLDWFTGVPDVIREKVKEWTKPITDWGKDLDTEAKSSMDTMAIGIAGWFLENVPLVSGFASWLVDVEEFGVELSAEIMNILIDMKNDIVTWISDNAVIFNFDTWKTTAETGISSLARAGLIKLAEYLPDFNTKGKEITENLSDGASSEESKGVWTTAISVVLGISSGKLTEYLPVVYNFGRLIVNNMSNGSSSEESKVTWGTAIGTLLTIFSDRLTKYLPIAYNFGRLVVNNMSSGSSSEESKVTWGDALRAILRVSTSVIEPYFNVAKAFGRRILKSLAEGVVERRNDWKSSWDSLKENAKTWMLDIITDVTRIARTLPRLLGLAISNSASGVNAGIANFADVMSRGFAGAINNTIIKGANGVLKFMGLKTRIPEIRVQSARSSGGSSGSSRQAYAKGTKHRKHAGGEALVGEEGPELAHYPNEGVTLVGQGGAEVLDLPKGASVLPHKETQQILKRYNFPTDIMPAYATGVGDYFEKFFNSPKKIITSVLGDLPLRNPLSGGGGEFIKGGYNVLKSNAISYMVGKIADMFSGEGNYAGGMGGINVPAFFGSLRRTSGFGWRTDPFTKKRTFHGGVDFGGKVGTAIKAQIGGKVTHAGRMGTFGNLVRIQNGAFQYYYAHLNQALAKLGSVVNKGAVIGTLGNTGRSTNPHLHYEVRKNGKAVPPNIQGFAKGGEVKKEQIIRVGEQDKAEMIIPMEQHRDRAVSLWKEAGERLDMFDYFATGGTVGKSTHTVKSGDTLSHIAMWNKTTVKVLMELNKHIKDANKIYVGQVITLKALAKAVTGSPSTSKTHNPVNPIRSEDNFEMKSNIHTNAITRIEGRMGVMTEQSLKFRDSLKEVIVHMKALEKLERAEIVRLEKRNIALHKSIKAMPAVSKQSEDQKSKYDEMMSEYNSNASAILSLRTSVEDMARDIKSKSEQIFINFVQEIANAYEKAINTVEDKIDDFDFKIDFHKMTNPDDMETLLDLMAYRAKLLQSQQATITNQFKDFSARYTSAVKTYGKNSAQALELKGMKDSAEEALEDIKLAVLNAEKDIRDTRGEIADEAISALKDYYGKMKDMSEQAIDAEMDALQKAHDGKMKLLDEEEERINGVYDARLKAMDEERTEENYNSELQDKNLRKSELLNKIALLSRDTSLEGRKRLAELQAELADLDKEISDFTRDRQDELMKEAIEKQRQEQLEKISKEKESEEMILEDKLAKLEEEKLAVQKHYEDILNNDKYWADMRNEFIAGSFIKLNQELAMMKGTLDQMNQGIFDGLFAGFNNLSTAVKQQIAELSALDIDNLLFGTQEAIERAKSAGQSSGYSMTDGNVTSGGTKVTAPKVTTPPPAPKPAPAPAPKPAPAPAPSTGTAPQYYTIQKGDTFSELEQRFKLPAGSLQKLNPTLDPRRLQIGQRIVLKSGSGSTGGSTGGTASANRMITSAVNFRSSPAYGNNVIGTLAKGAKVTYLGMEKGWAKIKSGTKTGYVGSSFLKTFETGGYTGKWNSKEGKMAILHEKEIVLKKDDTSNFLEGIKILRGVKDMIPAFKRNSVAQSFASSGTSITNNTTIDVSINVEKLNGKREDIKTLAKEVAREINTNMRKNGG